ncbi:MAG: gluconeogenesis factor YvcK family protein [Acidimicrobiales bacterium]
MDEADAVPGRPAGRPAVVAIGGGHGLAASLRAIRRYAASAVAIASVADDGGSSGRLRRDHPGLPAPGDIRRCLGALAADESVLGAALEHRFETGALAGHALGNLVLASLTESHGSFAEAVDELGRLIGAVGRVLPATVEPVALVALRTAADHDGQARMHRVVGQVAVQGSTGIAEVRLHPRSPQSPPEVAAAIAGADQVVLGPGSLFTSVLAAAVVPAVHRALAETRGRKIYIANLAPQVPETDGFTVADELNALRNHGVGIDQVVVDPTRPLGEPCRAIEVVTASMTNPRGPGHDPAALAEVLASLLWPAVEGTR